MRQVLHWLVDVHATVCAMDKQGQQPIHLAAYHGKHLAAHSIVPAPQPTVFGRI